MYAALHLATKLNSLCLNQRATRGENTIGDHFMARLRGGMDRTAVNSSLATLLSHITTIKSILAKFSKISDSNTVVNLQAVPATVQLNLQLDQLCHYFSSLIAQLETRNYHKHLLPEAALQSSSLLKAQRLVVLNRLGLKTSAVDVRIVRCFRIWQKDSTLNFYLDKMQEKMRHMKRGTVETRFRFIARHVRSELKRAFARWLLQTRTIAQTQALMPKPILTPDSVTLLGVLKLHNLVVKGRQNALGRQNCQRVSQAFLIWKSNSGIPLDYAYDNQMRL